MSNPYPPQYDQCCFNCRYGRPVDNLETRSQCRRYAPRCEHGLNALWSHTNATDWCGEWAPKDEEAP